MDEIAGFCPPSAEPPSKKPIVTLAKQARAFGYGMVLTTQNPMDFDYKVMSNAGTWAIGRLQTERDKARILEGMQSAAGQVDMNALDQQISGLGKRQFVLHTTRGKNPRLFTSRWVMSYLAGPLTKTQIPDLPGQTHQAPTAPVSAEVTPPSSAPAVADDSVPIAPAVALGIPVTFLDPAASWASRVGAVAGSQRYSPMVAATVNLLYDDTAAAVNHNEVFEAVLTDPGHPLTSETVVSVDHDPRDFVATSPPSLGYVLSAAALDQAAFWKRLSGDLANYLVASRQVKVWKNQGLKLYSRVGEGESEFRARCLEAAGSGTDRAIAALKQKYSTKIDRVRGQLATAERQVSGLDADVAARRQQEVVSGAGDLLGALLGGRRSSSISRAASRRSQTKRTEIRRDTASSSVVTKQTALDDLEEDLASDVNAITAEWDDKAARIEEVEIPLEKVDVKVTELKLVWVPFP
jgi:hypothetical protein